MSKDKINILVVDDHLLIRTGVINLLKEEPDMNIIGEAESGEQAVEMALSLRPDIVLMDISMPGISGLEATGIIKSKNPSIRVVILTIYKSEEYFQEALKKHVEGILHKNTSKEEILDALRRVNKGEKYIGQKFAQLVLENYNTNSTSSAILTRREKEILNLIAQGNTNAEIAAKLSISVRTVETHRTNLVQKLNLKSSSALTKYAIENFNNP